MSRNACSELREPAVRGKHQGMQPRRKPDERARRTCRRLGEALLRLILEKPYEEVTVREVLERASVGRSTFYLHYRDKNDLLLSQLEQFGELMSTMLIVRKEKSHRVMPVEEMFAHIAEQITLYRALEKANRLNDFLELAQGYFMRGIAQRLVGSGRVSNVPRHELEARATALAGSLISLLKWWLSRGAKESARSMDELFHRMVWKGMQ
ncbi:MAG: TetR/AcrR family transcriptional regulator [Candidatus Sulfotelmatobacter sp.]